MVFACLIGLIAADEGLQVERRVSAIGAAATRSVVYCLVGVLGVDTAVNALVYFIPGFA
jgi:ABC-type transporter Mla maintaining outer membrane lipid asymmetry permease subunit MlaE